MKKKLLALLLSTVLCVCSLLAFASCGNKNEIETKPIFNYIDTDVEKTFDVKALTEKVSFQVDGELDDASKNILMTVQETRDLAAATPVSYDTYRFYSLTTGTKLYEFVIDNLSIAEDRLTDVYFEYIDGSEYSIIVKKFYNGYGNVEVTLLDKNGAKVLEDTFYLPYYQYSSSGSALAMFKEYKHHVMFNNVLYRSGAEGYEIVEDFNVSPLDKSSLSNVEYINGRFIVTDTNTITVFDKDFSFVSSFKPNFSDSASYTLIPLNSGNVLVVLTEQVQEDEKDFDVSYPSPLGNAIKATYSYYIYDTASCVLNPIESKASVLINRITEIDGLKLPDNCTLVLATEICDKKPMSNEKYALLDANGKLLNFIDVPEGLERIETLAGNRAVFCFNYGAKVIYSLSGTKLQVVANDAITNIGTYYLDDKEGKIYDSSMTPVYEIPSEFDLVGYICNNTVFFEKDVELGNDEYYIWKDSVVTKLDADFIEVLENGYATIKLDTASASTTYNFYNAQGTIVKTVVSTVENPLTLDHGEENGKIFVLLTDKNEKTTLVIFAE